MSKSIVIELTAALVWGGQIQPAGTEIEVTEIEARKYLQNGKAKLAEGEVLELGNAQPLTTQTINGGVSASEQETAPLNTVDLSKLSIEQLHEYARAKSFTISPKNTKKADIQKELQEQLDRDLSKELTDAQAAELAAKNTSEPLKEIDLEKNKE